MAGFNHFFAYLIFSSFESTYEKLNCILCMRIISKYKGSKFNEIMGFLCEHKVQMTTFSALYCIYTPAGKKKTQSYGA